MNVKRSVLRLVVFLLKECVNEFHNNYMILDILEFKRENSICSF